MSNTDDKLNEVLEIADLPEKIKDITPKIPRPKEKQLKFYKLLKKSKFLQEKTQWD